MKIALLQVILSSTGYFLSYYSNSNSNSNRKVGILGGVFIFSLGALCHFTELYYLNLYYDIHLKQDFVFGTYFMALGAGYIALSNHKYLRVHLLSNIGKMTLGIYAIHIVYVDLFKLSSINDYPILWDLAYILIVFVLSVMSTMFLARFKILKKFVM